MNVLVIGAGGREHTLSWKIAQSEQCEQLFIAPGNAGTGSVGTNLDIKETDFESIKSAVLEHQIEMVVVGPEAPLVAGIHDFFAEDEALKNVAVIGPKKAGAELEGSKDFSKAFMDEFNIPTARYKTVTAANLSEGIEFLESLQAPYVLKADGLAAGKGVLILDDVNQAKEELKNMLEGKFGDASAKVVIEEFLHGIECSVFVLTNGKNYKVLPVAKDYKRIGEGDTGLNTGGMGSISPVDFADEAFLQKVEQRIVQPTIKGLQQRSIDYQGFIFIGLMNVNGDPFVVEYNVRMGDPETEVVIPRIKSDFLELLKATAENRLDEVELKIDQRYATSVMLVSGGYPEAYEKGKPITGFQHIRNALVFHAGTRIQEGKAITSGGRVLAVTAFGKSMKEALNISYENAELINFDKKYYRKDIGFDLK
jgi:phosphoribosylamine--glycine ligase